VGDLDQRRRRKPELTSDRGDNLPLRVAIALLVRTAGLEPALPEGKEILSLLRLPFRHVRLRRTYHIILDGRFAPRAAPPSPRRGKLAGAFRDGGAYNADRNRRWRKRRWCRR
jgi:hypothetical protein